MWSDTCLYLEGMLWLPHIFVIRTPGQHRRRVWATPRRPTISERTKPHEQHLPKRDGRLIIKMSSLEEPLCELHNPSQLRKLAQPASAAVSNDDRSLNVSGSAITELSQSAKRCSRPGPQLSSCLHVPHREFGIIQDSRFWLCSIGSQQETWILYDGLGLEGILMPGPD